MMTILTIIIVAVILEAIIFVLTVIAAAYYSNTDIMTAFKEAAKLIKLGMDETV